MTSPSTSITLEVFFEEKEDIFFASKKELAKNIIASIIPIVSQIRGLKKNNPKKRFKIIKNGRKQPERAKNTVGFMRFLLK